MYEWKVTNCWNDIRYYNDLVELLEYVFDPEYYNDSDETNQFINNEYGSISIDGYDYDAAEILENLNQDRYYEIQDRLAREKAEALKAEYRRILEHMEPGESLEIENFTIEYFENKENMEQEVSVDDLMDLIKQSVPQ